MMTRAMAKVFPNQNLSRRMLMTEGMIVVKAIDVINPILETGLGIPCMVAVARMVAHVNREYEEQTEVCPKVHDVTQNIQNPTIQTKYLARAEKIKILESNVKNPGNSNLRLHFLSSRGEY